MRGRDGQWEFWYGNCGTAPESSFVVAVLSLLRPCKRPPGLSEPGKSRTLVNDDKKEKSRLNESNLPSAQFNKGGSPRPSDIVHGQN